MAEKKQNQELKNKINYLESWSEIATPNLLGFRVRVLNRIKSSNYLEVMNCDTNVFDSLNVLRAKHSSLKWFVTTLGLRVETGEIIDINYLKVLKS